MNGKTVALLENPVRDQLGDLVRNHLLLASDQNEGRASGESRSDRSHLADRLRLEGGHFAQAAQVPFGFDSFVRNVWTTSQVTAAPTVRPPIQEGIRTPLNEHFEYLDSF